MRLLILACHPVIMQDVGVKFARGVCLVFKAFVVPYSIILSSSSSMPHNLEITLPQFITILCNSIYSDVLISCFLHPCHRQKTINELHISVILCIHSSESLKFLLQARSTVYSELLQHVAIVAPVSFCFYCFLLHWVFVCHCASTFLSAVVKSRLLQHCHSLLMQPQMTCGVWKMQDNFYSMLQSNMQKTVS